MGVPLAIALFKQTMEVPVEQLEEKFHHLRDANGVLAEYAARAREEGERKDEFLAMLAHELRNPLAAISSAQAAISS